jgi:phospholipase/carboxylesterase
MTRRIFFSRTVAGGVSAFTLAKLLDAETTPNRLLSRPGSTVAASIAPGLHPLGLRDDRDALLYVPELSAKLEKAPLVISLHGASGKADRGINLLRAESDKHGFLLLAPDTSHGTWDIISGAGGPDAKFIDASLARAFELRRIDRARIALAGISDGGTTALSLGLANGDLFNAILAFSPGFIVDLPRAGKPPIFISHGTLDNILPIEQTSRRIVPQLKRDGYKVTYREFEGPHTLPPDVATEAMRWYMDLPV